MSIRKLNQKSDHLKEMVIVGVDPAKDKHQLCVIDKSGNSGGVIIASVMVIFQFKR